ncbi:ras-related and estrogen-regulated growth inhibitor-like protein isoform X2 [Myxocyprinus asiaticus]|uniref:ras-related and estrogen-regulated growth inhibitor-like protein isoform X2 n=1 Tax=Myxocyprinus asiaticus TaxID=70543 RepID=UPI0022216FF6|nr:ras-related and estrogen-regulated growth inhibitor-like protein isoform X2 [Myxocyprinus asiaticus]
MSTHKPRLFFLTLLTAEDTHQITCSISKDMTGIYAERMNANVVVLGTDNVGKSALTVRFLTRRFIGEYGDIGKFPLHFDCFISLENDILLELFFPPTESIYSHNVVVDGREQTLNIWDAPYSQSQDLFSESLMCEKRVQWADGFVLVYSICDRASFNAVTRLIQTIKTSKDFLGFEKMPIVIVGNKRDLHHRRTVLSEEGRLLALSADCQFYEVSAAENYHSVLMVFHGLVNRIRESRVSVKRLTGIKGIVKSMSAVFARRRTDSL